MSMSGEPEGGAQNQPNNDNPDANNDSAKNNGGDNEGFRFSWDHGLAEPKPEDNNQQVQQQQQQQQVQNQNQNEDASKQLENYLEKVPVQTIQFNEEQFEAFKNGSLEEFNEQLVGMQKQGHLHTLQTANQMVRNMLKGFKEEVLREANVSNISTDVMDYVKSQHAASNDPILGPVIESAVRKIMANGTVDKEEISKAVGKILEHMGEKAGGKPRSGSQHNPALDDNPNAHEPDNWFDFVQNLG